MGHGPRASTVGGLLTRAWQHKGQGATGQQIQRVAGLHHVVGSFADVPDEVLVEGPVGRRLQHVTVTLAGHIATLLHRWQHLC